MKTAQPINIAMKITKPRVHLKSFSKPHSQQLICLFSDCKIQSKHALSVTFSSVSSPANNKLTKIKKIPVNH